MTCRSPDFESSCNHSTPIPSISLARFEQESRITIAELENRRLWDQLVNLSGVPCHTWSNVEAYARSGLCPFLVCVEYGSSRMILPIHCRSWGPHQDIATLVCVSGASLTGSAEPLLHAWKCYAASRGWVAGYLQFEPSASDALGPLATPGNTVFLLPIQNSDPLTSASTIIRRKWKQAEQQGVSLVDDGHALAGPLERLHPITMARSGASPHYAFSQASLRSWATASEHLVVGARRGVDIEAVMVFLVHGDRAEFHIGASTLEGRALTAWLLVEGIRRLGTRGVRTLNLGGGVRAGDGLCEFKRKFGGTGHRLPAVRQIYLPDDYNRLCRQVGVKADQTWFPGYRAPSA